MFCKTCGVQSFYQPRSNPDGIGKCQLKTLIKLNTFYEWYKIKNNILGVMPHCIDSGTIISTIERTFDGSNWENAIQNDPIIKGLSKE